MSSSGSGNFGFNSSNAPWIKEVDSHLADHNYIDALEVMKKQVARVLPMSRPNEKKRPMGDGGDNEFPMESVQNSNKVVRQLSMQNVRDVNGRPSNGAMGEPMEQGREHLQPPPPKPSTSSWVGLRSG